MRVWSQATLKSLLVPGGALLLAVVLLVFSGWLTLALPAISFLYYCALIGGILLAWRFHSSRIFLALVVLFLAGQALGFLGEKHLALVAEAVSLLVPLNFVLIGLMHERGFSAESITPAAVFLFVQCVVVITLCSGAPAVTRPHHPAATLSLPGFASFMFAAAGILLLGRFLLTRKPTDSALLWSLAAFSLSLVFSPSARISTLYAATAACTLAVSIIENSYLLAYHDELTTLPSRRAFNEAMMRLQEPYSIAVVDIDHFKKFNDTYGHDIGDQVLRLVASNLGRVTGGGQAYRCGGEEFNILFPGKTTSEVVEHLENLRKMIESSEFRMRGGDRRQAARGPERRARSRGRKGDAIRQLVQQKPLPPLSVTVSIGVATSAKRDSDPEALLKAADKALYRAKENGRNRVETASPVRRGRVKAAGIA
ncbi:MAG TPA: GGDEF domain-containing protein [Candidatus Sulfotelmatobacter sp.]|nr:GGDEF domain-containing protein [Candidatus Sulfotelmatobacter sp.]